MRLLAVSSAFFFFSPLSRKGNFESARAVRALSTAPRPWCCGRFPHLLPHTQGCASPAPHRALHLRLVLRAGWWPRGLRRSLLQQPPCCILVMSSLVSAGQLRGAAPYPGPKPDPHLPFCQGGRRKPPQPHVGPLIQVRFARDLSEKPQHLFYKKCWCFEEMGKGGETSSSPCCQPPPTLAHLVPAHGKRRSPGEGGDWGCVASQHPQPSFRGWSG